VPFPILFATPRVHTIIFMQCTFAFYVWTTVANLLILTRCMSIPISSPNLMISPHQDAWLFVSIALFSVSIQTNTKKCWGDARAYRKVLGKMISSYQHAQAYEFCAKDILPIAMRPQKNCQRIDSNIWWSEFQYYHREQRLERYPPKSPVWTALIDNMTCILL
jgi:hypothetical protein